MLLSKRDCYIFKEEVLKIVIESKLQKNESIEKEQLELILIDKRLKELEREKTMNFKPKPDMEQWINCSIIE